MAISKSWATVLIGTVFFGALALFGSLALYICSEGAFYGYRSAEWPVSEGVIEEARLETSPKKDGGKKYRLVLRYRYQVEGGSFTNDRVQFLDDVFSSNTHKEDLLDQFRPGQKVSVRYHPSDPQRAVLLTGFPVWTFTGGVLLGLLFLGLGLGGLFLLRK